LLPTAAFAQGEAFAALVPTELSAGLGGVIEGNPRQGSAAVNLGPSRVRVRDQWAEPTLEMGVGPWSNEALCQDLDGALAHSDNCVDASVLFGPRFRPLRQSDRRWRPFVHFLLGAYWAGTGLKEPKFVSANIANQTGGGIDLRPPTSIHGVRFSADYRRVFAGERGRHQLQVLVSYFVGSSSICTDDGDSITNVDDFVLSAGGGGGVQFAFGASPHSMRLDLSFALPVRR
jgi:hypothetical protein